MYRIALPKGALFKSSCDFLAELGIFFELGDRKLILPTNLKTVEVLIVRTHDVALYVEQGGADLGIVGSDVLQEKEPRVITLKNLNFGFCKLVLAASKNKQKTLEKFDLIPDYSKVATKFPHLTKKFFDQLGITVEIIELYGSIELAPLTNLSDLIVDLVGTGRTLKENGLFEIEKISEHSAHLIAHQGSWQLNHAWFQELLENKTNRKQNK